MPIYEYECDDCGHRFDLRRGFEDDDSDVTCPGCGAGHPRRAISMFGTCSPGGDCAPAGGSAPIGGG